MESYDESSTDDEFNPPQKRFRSDEINTKAYYKEVKRLISRDLDFSDGLHEKSVLGFSNRYHKELKNDAYSRPDPYYDGWMMLIGKQRDAFDAELFLKTYPCVKKKIQNIRERCSFAVGVIDRTENRK